MANRNIINWEETLQQMARERQSEQPSRQPVEPVNRSASESLQTGTGKSGAESREQQEFPSAEECEVLQKHPEYKLYRDGMWQVFLKENKDLGSTEEGQREFQSICQEFLQEDVKALIERGNLKGWQAFLIKQSSRELKSWSDEDPYNSQDIAVAVPTHAVDGVSVGQISEAQTEYQSSIDHTTADQSIYFDRSYTQPLLEKFLKLDDQERDASGVDYQMLFYFLEGPPTGKVDFEWPVKIHNGREITKDEYTAQVKKMDELLKKGEQSGDSLEGETFESLKDKKITGTDSMGDKYLVWVTGIEHRTGMLHWESYNAQGGKAASGASGPQDMEGVKRYIKENGLGSLKIEKR